MKLAASCLLSYAAASNAAYSLSKIIPWSPSVPKSVDQSVIYNGTYYLSDRSNGVHVIDLQSGNQTRVIGGFVTTIVNKTLVTSESGPDGLVILPDRDELWAGDDHGMIRVIDLHSNTIIANISTGSVKRADEFAYDANSSTVVVTNPNEDTPYVSVIDASNRTVMGKVMFMNASGLEQPAFNPSDGKFYISVPSSGANPGGFVAVLDLSNPQNYSVSHMLPLPECIPAGIVFGVTNQLFVSCSSSQLSTFGYEASYIIDATSGAVLANISGVSGVDQVTYSASTKYFYASAYQDVSKTGTPAPMLYVIAANGTIVQSIATDNSTAHSVAVQAGTGEMLIPIKAKGIEVYTLSASSSSNSTTTSSASSGSGSTPSSSSTSNAGRLLGGATGFFAALCLAVAATVVV